MAVDSKKTSVLYLSYDGMTDALGHSQVLAYLKRMASTSCNIHLISFEKKEAYAEKGAAIQSIVDASDLHWHPLEYTKKPPILSTVYDLWRAWKLIQSLHATEAFDIVHCRGYVTAVLGLKCKDRLGMKFIFDMRGWWADEKLESGHWSARYYQPVYRYFKKLENRCFALADTTVSLTLAGANAIVENNPEAKTGVIPTCVDFETFEAFSVDKAIQIRKSLGIPENHKVLVYSGSLGGNYNEEVIFNYFACFRQLFPNAFFLILAKTGKADYSSLLSKLQIPETSFCITSVDYKDVGTYLMAADLGLVYYHPSFSVIGRSPTKLGEYWASGIPCISQEGIGDLSYLSAAYPGGLTLVPAKATDEQIIRAMEVLFSDSKCTKETLRAYSIDYFGIDRGVRFYLDLYRALKFHEKK